MNAVATRMTAEQYLAVDYRDDRWRELIDGLVVVNEPLPAHGLLQFRLMHAIGSVYEERGLGELWLVDGASRTVLVFRRSTSTAPRFDVALELAEGEAIASPALPGFSLAVCDLFAPHRR